MPTLPTSTSPLCPRTQTIHNPRKVKKIGTVRTFFAVAVESPKATRIRNQIVKMSKEAGDGVERLRGFAWVQKEPEVLRNEVLWIELLGVAEKDHDERQHRTHQDNQVGVTDHRKVYLKFRRGSKNHVDNEQPHRRHDQQGNRRDQPTLRHERRSTAKSSTLMDGLLHLLRAHPGSLAAEFDRLADDALHPNLRHHGFRDRNGRRDRDNQRGEKVRPAHDGFECLVPAR